MESFFKHPINDVQWVEVEQLPECLSSNIDKKSSSSECWNWIGRKNVYGYGVSTKSRQEGTSILVHRRIAQISVGNELKGMVVMHSCDNPSCCNPSHLSIGTQHDNIRDRHTKDRDNKPVGSKHPRATMNEVTAKSIKHHLSAGILSVKELALLCDVNASAIYDIKYNRSWSHV